MHKHITRWAAAALLVASYSPMLQAQGSNNILGLPAVPQTVPASPGLKASQATGSRAASSPPASAPTALPVRPPDADIKSAISGSIKLASSYQPGQVTVRIVTDKTYVGNELRAQALQAARLVQRDIRLSCGKLCKPGVMPEPKLLADNTLSFDLILGGYAGLLSTADMINLVNARAISPGSQTPPAPAVPAPAVPAPAAVPGSSPSPISAAPVLPAASASSAPSSATTGAPTTATAQ